MRKRKSLLFFLIVFILVLILSLYFYFFRVDLGPSESYGYICNVQALNGANCFGDVNGDGFVNAGDKGFISANIGQTDYDLICQFDMDGNGFINAADRAFVSTNIGLCTPLPDYQDGSGMNDGVLDPRFPRCGDEIIQSEFGESCDGGNLDGETCASLFPDTPEGTLRCMVDCSDFDESLCTGGGISECGNGIIEGSEACDCINPFDNDYSPYCSSSGSDVSDGSTCQDFGFNYGRLLCDSSCSSYSIEGCSICGNGIKEGREPCDDLSPEYDCPYGQIDCGTTCTDGCLEIQRLPNFCGDGNLDAGDGEECDDSNNEFFDGCRPDCLIEDVCVLDQNLDQFIDENDVGVVNGLVGCTPDSDGNGCGSADVNEDGIVDSLDVIAVSENFGPCSTFLPWERTADMPDSWLVIYNLNNPESIEWKDWYIAQWGIPAENTFGVHASLNERILGSEFEETILTPMKEYLLDYPLLENKIMGILVGYGVPGNYYILNEDGTTRPDITGSGGYSISAGLALPFKDYSNINSRGHQNRFFVQGFNPNSEENLQREFTKYYMDQAPGQKVYLSARIDAPTLEQAKDLTRRAMSLTMGEIILDGGFLYYDDYEEVLPTEPEVYYSHYFLPFTQAVERENTLTPQSISYPWIHFDSYDLLTNNALMRFSFYNEDNWGDVEWSTNGPRILHYSWNRFGATTLRSTTEHNERSNPNALFVGGYAVAIGATSEIDQNPVYSPESMQLVYLSSIGRILPEAMLISSYWVGEVWEYDGDPFLRLPCWIGDDCSTGMRSKIVEKKTA